MSRGDMFSRWSERRARVAREETKADEVPAEVAPDLPEPATEEEEDALLARLGLPRPEDVAGPEIRKFLARGVPEFLRRRALRTLWRSDPTFAVLDGLNDYDEDFNLPEFNQKIIATAYQVGKGIVREVEQVAVEEPAEVEDVAAAPETEAAEEADAPDAPEKDVAQVEQAVPEDEVPEPAFAPKRMSFDT